jgi:hypothetical protein
LDARPRYFRRNISLMPWGIVPLNLLRLRLSSPNDIKLPMPEGMVPDMEFLLTSNLYKYLKRVISDGNVPIKFSPINEIK